MSQVPLLFESMVTEERVSFLLTVSRDNLINGTLSTLVAAHDSELKKPLRVLSLSLSHTHTLTHLHTHTYTLKFSLLTSLTFDQF